MATAAASKDRADFLLQPLPRESMRYITGNAPQDIKEIPVKWLAIYRHRGNSFACNIAQRIKVVDVSVVPNVDDPLKKDGRVTTEIEVTPDMCNPKGVLHDGCKVFLIDECSATVLTTINAFEGHSFLSGVSQTMNVLFHAPASVGTKLRIVSRSLTSGNAMNSCRCEVWDTKHNRLVASGTQIMMDPSTPTEWSK
ncbi:hypothetical protein P691DRAFT_795618 [Macrolepiota fuliginosa MF-IS2]|uniref:Thioesterase domain-containing protein n=1 Tax=Macrolepiota fuliginosa MF-IS2 TaxID=1400762 RepID=A0A9P6C195_9AGAR|nr:hypothetical protein P691DRAFT_795618 [Macrolepiota fuliginosa MF-IS2]